MSQTSHSVPVLLRSFAGTLLVLLTVVTPRAQPADPDVADRLLVATRIYALVQQYFAHWEGAARDAVDGNYRKYVADALRTTDRRDFDLATLRFIAPLRNGHTQFFDDRADGRPLKFRLLELEHEWVVISSQD